MDHVPPHVGTAGWSIASRHASDFPGEGTHLARYARVLDCVEIDSSFYRPHRRDTYERWARSVPEGFRFSVKLPKAITHEARLAPADESLSRFLGEVGGLGGKLAIILIQLPPSLVFDRMVAAAFLEGLRGATEAGLVLEPRHESWFGAAARDLMARCRVARVAADPPRHANAGEPDGWPVIAYFRMHGSPRVYASDYDAAGLAAIRARLDTCRAAGRDVWCIFDNTARGHALPNALSVAGTGRSGRR